MIFELYQSGCIKVAPPQVQLAGACVNRILDDSPDQTNGTGERMEFCIRATVFVRNDLLEGQRHDAGYRCVTFKKYSERQTIPHAIDHIAEPRSRLRRNLMP